MQPLGKHGRGSPSVERFVGAATNVSETEERIDDDRQRQRYDEGCRRDMSARCRDGSGTPKRIA